ncbi:MarR family EPS-associated transcriptional regulator [Oceaniovalibus sp. ACAM 378]|jgi:EPS-associated MarR family transcriptional regulator|uniref:MarR family EPS-associated transcriptional regulator n=1 Tax=Oceaniovalibus sp. ACAM 378 TaxID=2599923 RepID=UPI0011DA39AF|nr:MarR family EPS-associated transcriptional regulator [Oceaniovalibus sp. ACAM 378]TYB85614.1 MarR family EPS-associated transcriptional regulator [Oceaniovalibus sp. ACAM 378]
MAVRRCTLTDRFDEDAHYRVLRLLQDKPDLSQREIAGELGVALGSVNYILRALIDKGLVKTRNFRNSGNKLRYAYILTPEGISRKSALAADFLRRKLREYEALRAEIAAVKNDLDGTAKRQL